MRVSRTSRGSLSRRVVPALLVVALAFAGCSDGGDGDSAGDTTTSEQATGGEPAGPAPLAPPTSRAGVPTTEAAATLPCRTPRRQSGPTFEVAARDNRFEPTCMALTVDQGINVTNQGAATHNFTLEEVLGDGSRTELIDFGTFEPGENAATEAFGNQGPGGGVFRLYCKIHEADAMESFLEVT